MKAKSNGSRLEESAILLQQAMADLVRNQAIFLQNQALHAARMDRLEDKMDRKFAEIDRRFEHIESLLLQKFAELPAKVFGFAQAAAKGQPGT